MKRILLFTIILVSALQSSATVRGGEITYKSLENNRYAVTVVMFQDCDSTTINPIFKCKVGSDSLLPDSVLFVSSTDVTGIPTVCSLSSRCQGNSNTLYGVRRLEWTAYFSLDTFSSCQVIFSAEACCRPTNLTTVYAPQFYLYASLDQCLAPNTSSSEFLSPFDNFYLCHNTDVFMNFAVAGTSYDSFSYQFVGALTPSGQPTYSNFSPTKWLTFWGFPNNNLPWPVGLHLDPVTGDMAFRPTAVNEKGLAVVEVKQFMEINGVMKVVGTIRREFYVTIISCPNNMEPEISAQFYKAACAGEKLCMAITTDDNNHHDTTRISWNSGIPGATFTHNNDSVRLASGELCWTPDSTHIRNTPYHFTVTVKDNACPIPGFATRAFSIFVREKAAASPQLQYTDCGVVQAQANLFKNYQNAYFAWTVKDSTGNILGTYYGENTSFKAPPGKIYVSLEMRTQTPCVTVYRDSIVVPGYPQVSLPPDAAICNNDSLSVQASVSNGTAAWFEWKRIIGSQVSNYTTTQNQLDLYVDTTQMLIVSAYRDSFCVDHDTMKFTVLPFNLQLSTAYNLCSGDSLLIGPAPDSALSYLWSNSDTVSQIMVSQGGTWILTTTLDMCSLTDTISVTEITNPTVYLPTDTGVCPGGTVQLQSVGSTHYNYLWSTGDTSNSIAAGKGNYSLMATDSFGCQTSQQVKVTEYPTPQALFYTFTRCEGETVHIYSPADVASIQSISWSDGSSGHPYVAKDSGMIINQIITVDGCQLSDTLIADIRMKPSSLIDTFSGCGGDTIQLYSQAELGLIKSIYWSDGSAGHPYVAQHSATIIGSGITLDGCIFSDTFYAEVGEKPTALRKSFTGCQGDTVRLYSQLDLGIIQSVSWSDGSSGLPYVAQHSATIIGSGITVDGCAFSDTLLTNISKAPGAKIVYQMSSDTFFFTTDIDSSAWSYTWYFGDGTSATGRNQSKIYSSNGSFQVKLLSEENQCGSFDTTTVLLNVSVGEIKGSSIVVYPNPFLSEMNVKVSENCIQNIMIALHDVDGKLVFRDAGITPFGPEIKIDLSTANLAPGLYYLSLGCGESSYRQKVVKIE